MAKPKTKKKGTLNKSFSFGPITLVQKALFAKHVSIMLKSGLNIVEALAITEDEATGKFKNVLKQVLESVMSGNSLAESLRKHPRVFSNFFVNSVQVGEASGTLVENFQNIAKQLEKEQQLSSKIKGAMLYPLIIFGATIVLAIVLSFVVLPKIIPLFEGLNIELPLTTRILIWFSHFVASYGHIAVIVLVLIVAAFAALCRQKFSHPVTHWLLLHIPVVKGISKYANLIRFNRSLGILLKSGINIDEALRITSETVNNYYYQKAIAEVAGQIKKGTKLKNNLDKYRRLFPKLVSNMIGVGEETGRLDETLLYLADFYEFEVDNATKSLTAVLEPVLLLVIGVIVALFATAIITPIYVITGNVKA